MSTPPNALNPVSPERMNQQTLTASPSLPIDLLSIQRKTPRGSDVQSRVAFLNHLSRGDSSPTATRPTSSGGQNAALQRAILGREEAESALAKASSQLSESQYRERRISERVESLLEELQTAKERQANERVVFEKEIRKVRKEAFRAGSAVVKLQEELKHSRAEIKGLNDKVLSEREAKDNAKQQAFEREYTLASLTEELEVLKGRVRSVETNRHSDVLEAQARRMHREEIGRMTLTEGDLAFLATPRKPKRSAEDSVNSPVPDPANPSHQTPQKRQRVSDVTTQEENEDITTPESQRDTISELQADLDHERWRRADLEDMIHFMKMECQFKVCSCRLAEYQGTTYIYDKEYDEKMKKMGAEAEENSAKSKEHDTPAITENQPSPRAAPVEMQQTARSEVTVKPEPHVEAAEEPLIAFSPATGTFRTIPSPSRDIAQDQDPQGEPMVICRAVDSETPAPTEPMARSPLASLSEGKTNRHNHQPNSSIEKAAPAQHRLFTPDMEPPTTHTEGEFQMSFAHAGDEDAIDEEHLTTRSVPLRGEASSPTQFAAVPGTPINREEALAQIRARRGRAHSTKRSASASEASARATRMGVTPVRGVRRIPGFQQRSALKSENDKSDRRDLSAPIRMFHR